MADADLPRPLLVEGIEPSGPSAGAASSKVEARKSIDLDVLSSFFRRLSNLATIEFDLGRIGVVIAIPVLCWVFYTTSNGMVDVMRQDAGDWVGLIGAVVATTAVLLMLALTSWSLGHDLAALIARRRMVRERLLMKTIVTAIVFLFVFSISVFFSFTYYYNNIFKLSSKRIVAELQPMELAADVLLPTAKDIGARYDAMSAKINAAPTFRAYSDSLGAIIGVAKNSAANLRDALRKNDEAKQLSALKAAQQAAAELQDAQAAGRQLEETREKIATLDRSVADLDAIIKAKQDEITELTTTARQEEQLAVDASKGLDGLGAACGPNCLSHRAKANAAQQRIATIRQTLTAPRGERALAIRRRDALDTEAVALRQKAESASAAAKTPAAKTEAEASADLDLALPDLTDVRDQMRIDPTWAKVRQAKPSCEAILAALRQAKMTPSVVAADFACEPQGAEARELLSAREEVLTGRANFQQKCSLEGELRDQLAAIALRIRNASGADAAAASNGFIEAKKLVDACVVASKAAGLSELDAQTLLKRSDAYLRSHSMDRNKFELAREAFWSFTPDSTMAIFVAAAQDAFVFIMKFLSEIFSRAVKARERRQVGQPMDLTDAESDPVEARAMKALLRTAKPVHGDMSEFDASAAILADLPSKVQENLTAMVNRLVRDEIAHVDRKGAYVIDNRAIAEIETRLATMPKHWRSGAARALGGDRKTLDQNCIYNPRLYYGDASGEPKRRRRPTALERYLSSPTALEPAIETAHRLKEAE
jgi:hypothetical protein